jgi:hypothetical protein
VVAAAALGLGSDEAAAGALGLGADEAAAATLGLGAGEAGAGVLLPPQEAATSATRTAGRMSESFRSRCLCIVVLL